MQTQPRITSLVRPTNITVIAVGLAEVQPITPSAHGSIKLEAAQYKAAVILLGNYMFDNYKSL